MEAKNKPITKTKDALRQIQAELRQLQAAVNIRSVEESEPQTSGSKSTKTDRVVQWSVQTRLPDGRLLKSGAHSYTESRLGEVSSEAVAALGNAISSVQKVALLRALSTAPDGMASAALGRSAGLSAGSLYHHLHDLSHAGFIMQSSRNSYRMTERGRAILPVIIALAAQE